MTYLCVSSTWESIRYHIIYSRHNPYMLSEHQTKLTMLLIRVRLQIKFGSTKPYIKNTDVKNSEGHKWKKGLNTSSVQLMPTPKRDSFSSGFKSIASSAAAGEYHNLTARTTSTSMPSRSWKLNKTSLSEQIKAKYTGMLWLWYCPHNRDQNYAYKLIRFRSELDNDSGNLLW